MRRITEHKGDATNEQLDVIALDHPGSGDAHNYYRIEGYDYLKNRLGTHWSTLPETVDLIFQNGPIAEVGVNGITLEALLAVVADRLRSFQAGPRACRENALALTKLEEAMHWLHHRTRAREARGVEGTHTV